MSANVRKKMSSGWCQVDGPRDFRGTSKALEEPPSMEKLASELPIRLWAQEDLNLRPLPCQGFALVGGHPPRTCGFCPGLAETGLGGCSL